MPLVSFNITKELNERVERVMQQYGFGTRSEFFRFITLWYLETRNRPDLNKNSSLEPLDYIFSQHPAKFQRPVTEGD